MEMDISSSRLTRLNEIYVNQVALQDILKWYLDILDDPVKSADEPVLSLKEYNILLSENGRYANF